MTSNVLFEELTGRRYLACIRRECGFGGTVNRFADLSSGSYTTRIWPLDFLLCPHTWLSPQAQLAKTAAHTINLSNLIIRLLFQFSKRIFSLKFMDLLLISHFHLYTVCSPPKSHRSSNSSYLNRLNFISSK